MIHRYPAEVKAFYMKPDPNDRRSPSRDLLAPEGYGEIIGGGQRIDDLNLLEERIREHKLPREAFEWYLDLRHYGSVPHAGFGMRRRAIRRVDVRPRARPRDDPFSTDDLQDQAVKAIRRAPGRAAPSGNRFAVNWLRPLL